MMLMYRMEVREETETPYSASRGVRIWLYDPNGLQVATGWGRNLEDALVNTGLSIGGTIPFRLHG